MVKSGRGRKDKYEAKVDSEVIGRRYDATKDLAVRKQTSYFGKAVALESKVKVVCDGAPSFLHHFYIAFAEEFAKCPTSAERSIVFTKWAQRGLNWFYLLRIAWGVLNGVPELLGEAVLPPTACYYSFKSGQGNTVFDLSGNNHHGTIFQAYWTNGKIGNCLGYDGINDRVINGSYGWAQNATYLMWIKQDAIPSGDRIGVAGGTYFFMTANGEFRLSFYDGVIYPFTGLTAAYGNDVWIHVAFVTEQEGINTRVKIYVNGELDVNEVLAGLKAPGSIIELGESDIINWFKGLIDEFIIFHRVLTATEIKQYYNATAAG